MIEKIKTTLIVHGNVQKSDYRGRVISIAKNMDISGTIQNLSNGNVKIIAEGGKIDIDIFIGEIDIRNFLIKVSKIEREEDVKIEEREYESFYKLVSEGETDERLDIAAEVLKELAIETKNGFKEQKEHNSRLDSFISRMDEHNSRLDSFISRMDEHNSRLEQILEKLVER